MQEEKAQLEDLQENDGIIGGELRACRPGEWQGGSRRQYCHVEHGSQHKDLNC